MSVVVVAGNPKAHSRTLHAAQIVAERLTGRAADLTLDLADFGARLLDWQDASVAQAVAQVSEADLVIVASPTYKASYTGLLKVFLDRFAAGSLACVAAIPVMLGGDWRHSLAPEAFLKPVLAELGASTPTRALFLLDSDYAESDALAGWLDVARSQLPARLLAPAGAI
jgi:FMN reductase